MNKICRYHLLRSEGLRLYARKSWAFIMPHWSTGFHTSPQVQSKVANPLFTGDADMSWLDKMKDSLGIQGKLRYPHALLHLNGTRLYICCTQAMDYNKLMEETGISQTFFTWYKLTTLHIWLLMTRLITEGREGRHIRNRITSCFLDDMKSRTRFFGKEEGFSISNKDLDVQSELFLGALINYDEGYLGDDKALAGAIWRTLYSGQDVDAERLEFFVQYVRKQVHHIHSQPTEQILGGGWVTFLPPYSDKLDKSVLEIFKAQLAHKLRGM